MLYAQTNSVEPGGEVLLWPLNERHVRRILSKKATIPEGPLDEIDLTPFGVYHVPYIEPLPGRRWTLDQPEWTAAGGLRRTYKYED